MVRKSLLTSLQNWIFFCLITHHHNSSNFYCFEKRFSVPYSRNTWLYMCQKSDFYGFLLVKLKVFFWSWYIRGFWRQIQYAIKLIDYGTVQHFWFSIFRKTVSCIARNVKNAFCVVIFKVLSFLVGKIEIKYCLVVEWKIMRH